MNPTLAGFINFIYNVMSVPTTALSNTSPVIAMAFNVALQIVNPALAQMGLCAAPGVQIDTTLPSIYALAVYNLAADNLVNYAQDTNSSTPTNYWANLRASFDTLGFVSGVISSTSDEGTSESMVVMDAAALFTMANLQQLKTPWGRQYMAFAQDFGYLWGLS
jgi:hypothetical protein